ncbi:MAG: right-handed parallel beta-helix repeat-containing protein [Methanophagales archaeon]|nr:right-handed parallel beta-helix repeat-containing protein [Methanophagales archaeon]
MKKRYVYVIVPIVILAMLALAAFSTPAMAQGCLDDIKTRNCAVTSSGFTNGTITNGSVKVLENRTGPCNQNWTITLPPGDVVVAYVHWHRWGACPNNNPTAEFWNGNGQHQSISIPDSLCSAGNNETRGVWYSGFSPDNGNHHYYWRVNATPGTNTFRATGCYDTSGEHCDDRWFFAVINQTDTANITHSGVWWHNYGYRDIRQNSPTDPYTTWFYNASIGPVSDHSYTLWVAQSHYGGGTIDIYLNNCHLGTFSAPSGTFPLSLKEYNVPNTCIETDGSQTATWDLSGSDDYFYGYFATLAEKAVLHLPDLVVEDIMFPEVMNPGIGYTIEARIKNQGDAGTGGTFNVSLWIDGNFHSKVTGVGPLSAGANTTVSFTGVSLSGGCHNFTVVADCDNDVYEGAQGETNNASTEYYQVGNVIVVHNNSQLTSHPDFKNRGGIYYLENKTITNCVGCGITIENTTLPVVIQNCTVRDCNYEQRNPGWNQYKAGICLRNVTNVTIGGYRNTIENNTNAGIRVQNSTHVDIRDNYISNNTKYGIYVYPDNLVKPPYPEYVKYITITNNTVIGNQEGIDLAEAFNCTVNDNTVRDNTKYGVYVCGNYSCIYNNTIVNNSVYGMNLFNASHNIIFWNDFIDNNKTNPQYPEHQAYDMWKHQPGLNPHNHWNSTISDFVYKHDGTPDPPNDYPNVSYMGNYWDNGTCGDTNNNGICDSAYKIDGATAPNDYYPLKYSWRNTYKLMCGNVDASRDVDGGDYTKLCEHVGHGDPLDSNWAGDVDCIGGIDGGDYTKLSEYVGHGGCLHCCYCDGSCC